MGRHRWARRVGWAGVGLLAAGCGTTSAVSAPIAPTAATSAAAPTTVPATSPTATPARAMASTSPVTPSTGAAEAPANDDGPVPTVPVGPNGGPVTLPPEAKGVLSGRIITVDPGHNGGNFTDTAYIDQLVFNGREMEACDTTGTETDAGYTEAQFTWNVARYLTADLRARGATVVLTRSSNTGVGPCVTKRAAIGNQAHSNAAVSIHADGGPPGGRGFTILEPVADGPNNHIIVPSRVLGKDLRGAFAAGTGEPVSDYYGVDGIEPRDDLAGTNLSTVPKVFVECANMRNATDAALVTTLTWQTRAAQAIAAGLTIFLTRR